MSIVIHNLTVSYQSRPAVHHVNMTFADGCMYAIFGPNGAGKSTLLKAIMGLLKHTGSVQWQNLSRRDIAYLPQQSDIDRSQPLTVFELTAMGLWYEIGFFGRLT
ncbi:MAG: ATP-binding cassette domain-containing protein, partial [Kingella oralis]